MARDTHGPGVTLLAVAAWLATSAPCQTVSAPLPEQPPAYEVATIKPAAPGQFALPLRVYIQSAFGIPGNSIGWVIGPDWIDSARYVIQAKPPDTIREAMQTMTREQRSKEIQTMQQGLLAERFQLKAHFETRVMPVYELTVAKGGSKLKENLDATQFRAAVGASMIRGKATPISQLLGLLEATPDIGGRVVLDKTGLPSSYDFQLKWTPLDAASASATLPSANADGVSLFTAIEEQLGLKLAATKAPGQVLVIDHIERPSEN